MFKFRYAAVALIALALPSAAWAVTTSTSVTVSNSGTPLASATVTFTRVEPKSAPKPKTEPPRATTKTSPTGGVAIRYDDEDVKAGTTVNVTVRTDAGRVYQLSGVKLEDIIKSGIDVKGAPVSAPPQTEPRPRVAQPEPAPMVIYPGAGGLPVTFSGTWVRVPVVSGGTRFSGGAEVSIIDTNRTIPGVTGSLGLVVPTNSGPGSSNVLWGDYFYVDGGFGRFDDSVTGSVPIGTTSAFTYIFPNPASGSTGIGPTATGQSVKITTEGQVYDFALGSVSRVAAGRSGSFWNYGLGVRYRHTSVEHTIEQQSLTFPDLNVTIDLDVHSHFVGPNFTLGFEVMQPLPSGPFAGFSAFVAPGVLITEATARQTSRCGPCGAGPEFSLLLQRDFDDTSFAVMTGVNGFIGYRLNPNARVQAEASYQYLSRMMSFAVPTSPARQPIALVNDTTDSFSVGGRFVFDFNPVPERATR